MTPEVILDFWFGPAGAPGYGQSRPEWFRKDAAFDADLRTRFGDVHAAAVSGRLAAWEDGAASRLALIIVLDQFSRNLLRGERASFACDREALRLARDMVAREWDATLLPVMRSFVYLPFEHSENLVDQDDAVRLFGALAREPGLEGLLVWAEKHRDVIRRFGRFPHRNAILERASTPEEIEFLRQPGSSF